jgi:transcriptional regulator with XRE-family HTH domain
MSGNYKNFGDFLHQKRIAEGVSYRDLASVLGVSAPYISDVEKDRRNAPTMEKLEKIAEYFHLSSEERSLMFDLAGEKKSEVAPDIPNYIKDHDYVVSALRTARDLGASEEDWQNFVDELKRRQG